MNKPIRESSKHDKSFSVYVYIEHGCHSLSFLSHRVRPGDGGSVPGAETDHLSTGATPFERRNCQLGVLLSWCATPEYVGSMSSVSHRRDKIANTLRSIGAGLIPLSPWGSSFLPDATRPLLCEDEPP